MTHPNTAAVVEAARALGLTIEPVEFPEGTRTADDAARAIGVELGQIVKSLVFRVDGEVVIAMVSGSNRLDTTLLPGTTVERADANAVRAATGFPIGGVPPFGHPAPLRTFVDEDLLQYEVVWAAGGTPHTVFPASPQDLVRATNAIVCRLRETAPG